MACPKDETKAFQCEDGDEEDFTADFLDEGEGEDSDAVLHRSATLDGKLEKNTAGIAFAIALILIIAR